MVAPVVDMKQAIAAGSISIEKFRPIRGSEMMKSDDVKPIDLMTLEELKRS